MKYIATRVGLLATFAIGIAIGVGSTMALHVNRPGPEPGDWLGFVGALVGVVLTIVGALWLEQHRKDSDEIAGLNLVRKSAQEIQSRLNDAAVERGDLPVGEFRMAQVERESLLVRSLDKFALARKLMPKNKIDAWYSVVELSDKIDAELQVAKRELRIIRECGDNEAVIAVNLAVMAQIQEGMKTVLEQTIASLR